MLFAMIALFAEDQMSFMSILERLGAFGLLGILIVWFMRSGWPNLVAKFEESLKAIGASHLAAITKVVDEHREEQIECHKERLDNAKIAREVADRAAIEREKSREVQLQLAGTLSGIGETLKKLNKD